MYKNRIENDVEIDQNCVYNCFQARLIRMVELSIQRRHTYDRLK